MKQKQFTKQFKHLFNESGLSHEDCARLFKISLPTVDRWNKGLSAPHNLGRKIILDTLNKKKQT